MTQATARATRQPLSGAAVQGKVFTMADIASKGIALPNRYGLYAGGGFGKTSLLAYSRNPIFLMTRGETGLLTLINAGQLPPTPHMPELESWADMTAAIKFLRTGEHDRQTLVIDTMNGAERLLHEYVCDRDFNGDWTDKGFQGFMRGYDIALADWRMLQNSLDELRKERGMTIFLLAHAKVKTFKNPNGADYDRYTPEMNDKTWALTKGWLDGVFFGNFEVLVNTGKQRGEESMKKGKASETSARILYTNSDNPVFDAKNRMGLPDEIEMGESPRDGWNNLVAAIMESRKKASASATATETLKPLEVA